MIVVAFLILHAWEYMHVASSQISNNIDLVSLKSSQDLQLHPKIQYDTTVFLSQTIVLGILRPFAYRRSRAKNTRDRIISGDRHSELYDPSEANSGATNNRGIRNNHQPPKNI